MNLKKLNYSAEKEKIELLFQNYGRPLFYYAKNQWKVEEDVAWELVYQAIYKLCNVYEKTEFQDEGKLKSYLFKIFVNYLRNHLRDHKQKTRGVIEVDLKEKNLIEKETKEELSPTMKMLNKLLDDLEDWERILVLMRAQEFSYKEISKYIQKPEKNLKVYYARLKKQLAKKIQVDKNMDYDE